MAQQTVNTTDTIEQFRSKSNSNFTELYGGGAKRWAFVPFGFEGTLDANRASLRFPAPFAGTLVAYQVRAITAPTGAGVLFQAKKNGSNWFTMTLSDGTSTTGLVSGLTHTFAADDFILLAVDGVGSTEPGADITVVLHLKES
jgi:hypothetical protein